MHLLQTNVQQEQQIYWVSREECKKLRERFLMLKYTDITQNTYIQSWTVTEILAREAWNFDSCYTLTDYQIHIKTFFLENVLNLSLTDFLIVLIIVTFVRRPPENCTIIWRIAYKSRIIIFWYITTVMKQLTVIRNVYFLEYQHFFCNFLCFFSLLADKWQNVALKLSRMSSSSFITGRIYGGLTVSHSNLATYKVW
jgi:hypothetical protein